MKTINTTTYSKIQTAFIVLIGIALSLFVYKKGVIIPVDTIFIWAPMADVLIENNFNPVELSNNVELRATPILYFFWISTIALNKLWFGENWAVGVVVLNCFAGIFVVPLLAKTILAVTKKPSCSIFAGIALILCYDFHQWIPVALSETLFACISFSIFFLILSTYQRPSEPRNRIAGILILLGFALFFRPAGPPLVIFAVFSLSLIFFFNLRSADAAKRHNFIRGLALFLCCALARTCTWPHRNKFYFNYYHSDRGQSSPVG